MSQLLDRLRNQANYQGLEVALQQRLKAIKKQHRQRRALPDRLRKAGLGA